MDHLAQMTDDTLERRKQHIPAAEAIIEDIKFETLGCVAAIATTSMITELAKGKTFKEVLKIKFGDVEKSLGSLPPVKLHCADLSVKALHKAIQNFKE